MRDTLSPHIRPGFLTGFGVPHTPIRVFMLMPAIGAILYGVAFSLTIGACL